MIIPIIFRPIADSQYKSTNAILQDGYLYFVDMGDGHWKLKRGVGNGYNSTPFINDGEFSNYVKIPTGDGNSVYLNNNTYKSIVDLTGEVINTIEIDKKLLLEEDWKLIQSLIEVKSCNISTISSFSDKIIGEVLTETITYNLSNKSGIKEAAGGNISVSEGVWSGKGVFDAKQLNSKSISPSNVTKSSPGFITIDVSIYDEFDQIIKSREDKIRFLQPVYIGTGNEVTSTISDIVYDTYNTIDGKNISYESSEGSDKWLYVYIPNEFDYDVRWLEENYYNSADLQLMRTESVIVNGLNKSYKVLRSPYSTFGKFKIVTR